MNSIATELANGLKQPVETDTSLAAYTTLKVGGPARYLVTVNTEEELAFVATVIGVHGLRWAVVGRGSNMLISDDGFDGVVVVLGRGFRGIRTEANRVRIGAAEPLPTVANAMAERGLSGLSWGCAVPGTIGGAVRMNAGAHGCEVADNLVEVDVYRVAVNARETWPKEALGLSYRRSELPRDAIVLHATFALTAGDPVQIRREVDTIRAWRREHQPLNQPNCGSVFANPSDGEPAAVLIDRCGLKGFQVGGAAVSTTHANFIVTSPGARASDVVAVIHAVKDAVAAATGVVLHEEVVMLASGLHAPDRAAKIDGQ